MRKGWKTAYNLTQQTGAGDGGIITIHTPTGDVGIPYDKLGGKFTRRSQIIFNHDMKADNHL